ncbi:MAG: oligosaccharide flippase family protein [Chloroflexi bacterium]|nr:oligosaccharide flippase family protein [Chloroflexota bacterium]
MLATQLGPSGLGIFGQCTAFLAFIGIPIANGILPAANRYIPANQSIGEYDKVNRWVISTRTIAIGLGILVMIIVVPFAGIISDYLLGSQEYAPLIVLSAIAIPISSFYLTQRALIQSFKQIRIWSFTTLLISLLGLPIVIVLVKRYGLYGAVGQIILTSLIGGILATICFNWYRGKNAESLLLFRWDNQIVAKMGKFGGASLTSAIIFSAVILIIRSLIINHFGNEQAGIYHAVSSISLQYLSIGLFSLSVYWFPHLAGISNHKIVVRELNKFLRISFSIMIPILVVLMTFRTQVIELVYSSSFSAASALLPIQIIGDYFRIIFWIVSASLLPMVMIKQFMGLSISFDIVLLIISGYLLKQSGLPGCILAYAIVNGIWVFITYFMQRHLIGFRFTLPNIRLILSSGTVLCLAYLLSGEEFSIGKFILMVVSLGIWAFVSSTPEERQFIMHPRLLFSRVLDA